jgi:Lipocalin-like domain
LLTFHGDHVIHHVELSLFPDWVGTDQQRFVELSAQVLILSAGPLLLAGRQQVPRLTWRRVYFTPKPTEQYARNGTVRAVRRMAASAG